MRGRNGNALWITERRKAGCDEWYNRVVQSEMKKPRKPLICGAFQNVAVKERFELSIQFPVYTLSRRAP
ncbi:hypothetical protein EMIT0P218_50245 [Pseudomonas sp. IT-P218]